VSKSQASKRIWLTRWWRRFQDWWARIARSFENADALKQARISRQRQIIAATQATHSDLDRQASLLRTQITAKERDVSTHESVAIREANRDENLAFTSLRERRVVVAQLVLLRSQLEHVRDRRLEVLDALAKHQEELFAVEVAMQPAVASSAGLQEQAAQSAEAEQRLLRAELDELLTRKQAVRRSLSEDRLDEE